MPKVLKLYNTFTKTFDDVRLGRKLISSEIDRSDIVRGSLYICGPTVYSESHLGHAITYIRADLFRRFMRSLFNVNLTTVMNITDIDDKILSKAKEEIPSKEQNLTANPAIHSFNKISHKYYKSFVNDMAKIRVEPPDLTIMVSKQVPLIMRYIKRLEDAGHAYVTSKGDVYFNTSSIQNYVGRSREDKINRQNLDDNKLDPRDFALWKASKPGEPVWDYRSDVVKRSIPGRPGWHVQCSAIASAIFGNTLDFHFGGKDLIFPHHYNEEACCCAYHKLDTSASLHVWSKHWLHSGHLILRDEKMSKSLGNVVAIGNFIIDFSVNALRLLCITSHYRSDIELNRDLLQQLKSVDHKLAAFMNYISDVVRRLEENDLETGEHQASRDLTGAITQTNETIMEGICDGFDLERGLNSILDLARIVYNIGGENISRLHIITIWQLLNSWCATCGLEYGPMKSHNDEALAQLLRSFRQKVRTSSLHGLKRLAADKTNGASADEDVLKSLLQECDDVRAQMDDLGFVERDNKLK